MFSRKKSADVEDLKAHFEEHYPSLCRVAYQYMQDEAEAEDIVQDFFYSLWERKLLVNIHGDFGHYAKTSVRNRCLTLLKKRSRTIHCSLPDELLDESEDADYRTHYEQQLDQLYNDLQQLPERQREILQLSVCSDMKYKDISERLNISVNTIKTHIKLAYKKMRR
jgi:RNA polymerase sigma factor, sigma-70 family